MTSRNIDPPVYTGTHEADDVVSDSAAEIQPLVPRKREGESTALSQAAGEASEIGAEGDASTSQGKEAPPLSRPESPRKPGIAECRICQEEDELENLESPCACDGSVKFAHRKCVQRWCDEKGNTTCEICNEGYKDGYTAIPRGPVAPQSSVSVEVRDGMFRPVGHRFTFRDAVTGEQHVVDLDFEDYAAAAAAAGEVERESPFTACCKSFILMLLLLFLLRHVFMVGADMDDGGGGGDEDPEVAMQLFLLRLFSILLPCFIFARVLGALHSHRIEQESAALAAAEAAAEVALLLQSQARGGRVRPAPPPPAFSAPLALPPPAGVSATGAAASTAESTAASVLPSSATGQQGEASGGSDNGEGRRGRRGGGRRGLFRPWRQSASASTDADGSGAAPRGTAGVVAAAPAQEARNGSGSNRGSGSSSRASRSSPSASDAPTLPLVSNVV